MALYVVDSNFFIQAHRNHYPLDVVPSFWRKIIDLHSRGILCSIDKVHNEICKNTDPLSAWLQSQLPSTCFFDSSQNLTEYVRVIAWANSRNHHYSPLALSEFLHADEADAWLVSHAIKNGCKIVTYEKSDPLNKKKIKIPEACANFNIPFVNTIQMLRELGETL